MEQVSKRHSSEGLETVGLGIGDLVLQGYKACSEGSPGCGTLLF